MIMDIETMSDLVKAIDEFDATLRSYYRVCDYQWNTRGDRSALAKKILLSDLVLDFETIAKAAKNFT